MEIEFLKNVQHAKKINRIRKLKMRKGGVKKEEKERTKTKETKMMN